MGRRRSASPRRRLTQHAVKNGRGRTVTFYQRLSGIKAACPADGFAELRFEGATLAISSEHLIRLFNVGAATAAAIQSAILEFEVEDIDAVFERMDASGTSIVMATTLMLWGNRSFLLRDPDGNLVNIFPVPSVEKNRCHG